MTGIIEGFSKYFLRCHTHRFTSSCVCVCVCCQIEELASCLSFDSRQSSMESLASLDSSRCSSLSSRSASSSPVPPRSAAGAEPLHSRFKVSAKKALLLWVREQCHK